MSSVTQAQRPLVDNSNASSSLPGKDLGDWLPENYKKCTLLPPLPSKTVAQDSTAVGDKDAKGSFQNFASDGSLLQRHSSSPTLVRDGPANSTQLRYEYGKKLQETLLHKMAKAKAEAIYRGVTVPLFSYNIDETKERNAVSSRRYPKIDNEPVEEYLLDCIYKGITSVLEIKNNVVIGTLFERKKYLEFELDDKEDKAKIAAEKKQKWQHSQQHNQQQTTASGQQGTEHIDQTNAAKQSFGDVGGRTQSNSGGQGGAQHSENADALSSLDTEEMTPYHKSYRKRMEEQECFRELYTFCRDRCVLPQSFFDNDFYTENVGNICVISVRTTKYAFKNDITREKPYEYELLDTDKNESYVWEIRNPITLKMEPHTLKGQELETHEASLGLYRCTHLRASNNMIKTLKGFPEQIRFCCFRPMKYLSIVDFSSNEIETLPETWGDIKLKTLLLHDNKIKDLSEIMKIASLKDSLKKLTLNSNPVQRAYFPYYTVMVLAILPFLVNFDTAVVTESNWAEVDRVARGPELAPKLKALGLSTIKRSRSHVKE